MPEEGNDGGQPAGKTFTEDQLQRIVEERLARERKKYADYDDLKTKVAEFDQQSANQKSDMERVLAELASMKGRSEKAERDALVAKVAAKTGLSDTRVRRLKGDDEAALLADAGEVFDWKPNDDNGSGDGDNGQPPPPTPAPPPGRPRENLKPDPGAGNGAPAEETDPMKLAAKIPRL